MSVAFKKGDAVWLMFGDGFSYRFHWPCRWWAHEDAVAKAVVLDVLDDGMLIVEYAHIRDESGLRRIDWFSPDQVRNQVRHRSTAAEVES